MKHVECTACKGLPQSQAQYCHECKGVRFIEYSNCTHPDHLVDTEAMTGGWICKCGASGPWTEEQYQTWLKQFNK